MVVLSLKMSCSCQSCGKDNRMELSKVFLMFLKGNCMAGNKVGGQEKGRISCFGDVKRE